MSASHSTYVGALPAAAAGCVAGGAVGVSESNTDIARRRDDFRRLLAEVWADQAQPLVSLALGLGMRREQAADVLQDVYLAAIRKPPPIHEKTELTRWLFRVTANRCHLEHRRKGRWRRLWRTLTLGWGGSTRTDVSTVAAGELKREVERAMSELGDDDRALVAMRYFSDLNSREISEIVGMPESTVRGRLRAARRKLAQELAGHSDDD